MPPVPVSAVFLDGVSPRIEVTFDRPIKDPGVPLDAANWTVIWAANVWTNVLVLVLGGNVVVNRLAQAPAAPPDRVSYAPPPFDVVGLDDVPAAAFVDFPVV